MQSKHVPMAPEPREIELKSAAKELSVSWSDEHKSTYSLEYLRGFCPCAQCQGHELGDWTFVKSSSDIGITSIEEVGNYAVSITFSDTHATGIYSWEVLRELCPCTGCRALHGDSHAMTSLPVN